MCVWKKGLGYKVSVPHASCAMSRPGTLFMFIRKKGDLMECGNELLNWNI